MIESTAIDAPWRSILALIPETYPWCSCCKMDCRDREMLLTCEACSDYGVSCWGCLSKHCEDRFLVFDLEEVDAE